MKRYDLIVIGAGPSGLSAAIEGARKGLSVIIFDENEKPGGQLFKQIHKFFGSKEHRAKIRGFRIGEMLLQEASDAGVTVCLNAAVIGIYQDKEVVVHMTDQITHVKGDTIIVATGASENMIAFEGWMLPGVIGAGAAQTMLNLYNLKPGNRILMLGSGNVGLVVSYQLQQCGCQVVAVVDAAEKVGGYGVHAAKVARMGVPFYLSHTIVKAEGTDKVTGVVIGEVDERFNVISGTEKHFDVDTICLAVGLSPASQLLKMAGCKMVDSPEKGGLVPVVDEDGQTSISGIYAAGDVSGIEEASSAMIEGRISGNKAAAFLGYMGKEEQQVRSHALKVSLEQLRQGMFAPANRKKRLTHTEEGYPLSSSLLSKGYLSDHEVEAYPGVARRNDGVYPVIECTQNIPCNPCQDACVKHCIRIGDVMTSLPAIDPTQQCIGCGRCVAHCPGQAIFLINEAYEPEYASVTIPCEFLPLPVVGQKGAALGRNGKNVCDAEVVNVKTLGDFDKTSLVTIKVPKEFCMQARFFKAEEALQNEYK